MKPFILFLLFATTITAIIIGGDGGGYGGGRGGSRFSSSSSGSWSSEEHGHHHGHHHGGNGRPHRPHPRPPRPNPRPPARPQCERGWMRFERPNGVWCVKVGNTGVTNGYMSQAEAQTQCSLLGATLTGYQTDHERITVANAALTQVRALGQTIGGLWLGATNNAGCRVASCGPYNSFRWTDGHTTGVAGFKWGHGEPDGLDWGPSACIQQFIRAPEWRAGPNDWAVWGPAFAHGDLDKYRCGVQAKPVTRLYACGKPAARPRG